jgi:hypothetical protein
MAAGATLREVRHESLVHFSVSLPEPAAAGFLATIDDAAQGRAIWQPA